MEDAKLIQVMAEAMWRRDYTSGVGHEPSFPFSEEAEEDRRDYLANAHAALVALRAADHEPGSV